MGIAEDIEQFEQNLKELITKYEQYFLGLEKREPLKLREDVERFSRRYNASAVSNTMLLFRYNSLKSRLASYRQHWNRITRLIEEGKYHRDRFKMERESVAKAKPSPVAAESEVDQLFHEFTKACRMCNVPTANITREAIASSLRKHRSAITEKYRCGELEFRVLVEDGKPKIKARPK
ncbi:MAG TPA: MXAN_5187 C-terminal domain-containing protein [Geobacteraceae bacterium]|nr:MXAN_5187 C-terminal domain-containing protein [Geobacteraceae bacterium]